MRAISFAEALGKAAQAKLNRNVFRYGYAGETNPNRCKTCRYGGGRFADGKCGLFMLLNTSLATTFALDEDIGPTMRCNAWSKP